MHQITVTFTPARLIIGGVIMVLCTILNLVAIDRIAVPTPYITGWELIATMYSITPGVIGALAVIDGLSRLMNQKEHSQ